jgi:hypothetical protein
LNEDCPAVRREEELKKLRRVLTAMGVLWCMLLGS